ncbi:DEAD/DEAH box helicase [Vibrio sp. SS-MA-C1-2]|uniref:DEAD/DEAH box helicase n=1 Tax=Vibrio sp. SS-MA-C1-2 TaxID=2908646 RepID=UPI001F1895CC|nr:DEAD/DEAH box helicase [Vibrio sp. SS-MA-C1-2]UJF17420.1 DEAD/DEAH box helicase [Vibrio sp. SS-MA-C1-2]
MSFSALGLSEILLQQIEKAGFVEPTEIQSKTIPSILEGKDLLAAAQTGSGKTASFVLPLIDKQLKSGNSGRAKLTTLVLVPTRELAAQIGGVFASFSMQQLKVSTVYGGVKINPQMMALRGGTDVLVATPGRLLDLVQHNAIKLHTVETLVLDEADRMLDLGFSKELNEILALLPNRRQNLFFSATFPEDVQLLTDEILNDPVKVSIEATLTTADLVQQRAIEVDRSNRTMLLKHLLNEEGWSRVLVFAASKRGANNITMKLERAGIKAKALHGDLSQSARSTALFDFKMSRIQVLVATDVAARGIDIEQLPCVVNFDLPRSPADYVHRIGRTGRAGEQGVAISFITVDDDNHFRLIEKRTKQRIVREQIDGFLRENKPMEDSHQSKEPIKGKRMSKKDKARAEAARLANGE